MRRGILIGSLLLLVFASSPIANSLGSVRPPRPSGFVPAKGNPNVLVRTVGVSEQSAALDYWTAARMAAAKPRDMTAAGNLPTATRAPLGAGIPGMVPGRDQAGNVLRNVESRLRRPPPFVNTAYRYPYPFDRFEVPGLVDYTQYPYSAVGKIFFTDVTGDYVCSGAVINSENGSVVWTAGHCSTEGGNDMQSAIFVPGYLNGAAPFGQWAVQSFWVPKQWVRTNNQAYDFSAYVLAADPTTGQTIIDVTGGLGIAWNVSDIQHWYIMGYPAAAPFDGERQWTCSTSQASFDLAGDKLRDPLAIGVGCDMTGGSSGGPWILSFGNANLVNGLVSYGYQRYRKATFGPYFGNEVRDLFNCARDGVC